MRLCNSYVHEKNQRKRPDGHSVSLEVRVLGSAATCTQLSLCARPAKHAISPDRESSCRCSQQPWQGSKHAISDCCHTSINTKAASLVFISSTFFSMYVHYFTFTHSVAKAPLQKSRHAPLQRSQAVQASFSCCNATQMSRTKKICSQPCPHSLSPALS